MATFNVILTEDRVELPVEVRAGLGARNGDTIEFVLEEGQARILVKPACQNPFDKWAGSMPSNFLSMEEIVAWEREMRDPDNEYM